MDPDRLRAILDAARTKTVLIAGDLILDEFVWGDVSRISPEAPVPVVRVTGESWYPGGAANVARNVREFAGAVSVIGAVGDDDHGRRLISILSQAGVDSSGVVRDPLHFTTVKTRVIAKHQQVVRVDRERIAALSEASRSKAVANLRRLARSSDAIILSDYAKGFLDQAFVSEALGAGAASGAVISVDPSPFNPVDWSGATAIKPNRSEALRAAGLQDCPGACENGLIERAGNCLLDKWRAKLILVTLGEDGMLLFQQGSPPYHTPTRAREVFDVSGAGDTAIAAFSVALVSGAAPAEAAEIANEASGIVVGKLGTATVTRDELIARCAEAG
jgi:rfaE bifunctional protein kinase chain/domain